MAACRYSQNRDLTRLSSCFLAESGSSKGVNINKMKDCSRPQPVQGLTRSRGSICSIINGQAEHT